MKKTRFLFITLFILFSVMFLFGCEFLNQNKDSEYKLIYKTVGNGYIACDYDSMSMIESGTSISLTAYANNGSIFVGWYDEEENNLSTEAELTVVIAKKTVLYAKFKVENNNNDDDEEDLHTKLSMIEEGKEAFIKATVIVTFKNGFILKDDSGYGLVYLGKSSIYSCGDIIEFKTTPTVYKNKIQIQELRDCERVGFVTPDVKVDTLPSNISEYLSSPEYGKHVCFTGTIVLKDGYYDIEADGYDNLFYPYNYDESIFHLANLVGEKVKVCGYLWGGATANNPYIILESVDKEDIIVTDDYIIKAYFNSSWTSPYIVLNNYDSYRMTLAGDHYEFDAKNKEIETVMFRSGDLKTEVFNFDTDSYAFVLGEKRYNNNYDGYFTDQEKVFNEVTKITALELNDLHGYVERVNGKNGISNASYLINQIRNEDDIDNVVLVANGDIFQGTAFSNLTKGASVIDIMNEMDFDFMGIGNHEFDWGLDQIYRFFDKDLSNGEATFPLVNSNIYYKDTHKIAIDENTNVVESLMIEKNGIKIGVVSCIGMLKSSILATRTENYDFESIVSTATPLCKDLRDKGADIIICNLHDGSSTTVSDYTTNKSLSNITYQGKNLVDIIINGHTHVNQYGYIERSNADVPITQAACNCQYLGELAVYYDHVADEVVYSRVATHNLSTSVGTNYDEKIEAIVEAKYNEVKDQIEETYCMASATVTQKNQLFDWASQVMLTCTGADCGISNTGGIRSTGKIQTGNPIQLGNMFEIIPFDNEIILCNVSGSVLKTYLQTTSNYYGLKSGLSVSSISNSKTYKVAVIDYVYYGSYFMANSNPINTHIAYRDALIEDLKLRTTFNVNTDKTPVVGLLYKGN